MELTVATRKQAKIKMALQGPAGSGKTLAALKIAYGLCKDWSKIAVIDTENRSASLYSHLGKFSVVNVESPYHPEKFIEAIKLCEKAQMEVIVIDSISHEWDGPGGILEIHSNMLGNSFTAWGKLTPRHNAFVQTILQSMAHIVCTIRSKQDYILTEKNGKQVPEKVGLKGITRDGMDYEFTLVLDIDIKHNAVASKDRTFLFMDKPEFKIDEQTGSQISEWCNEGEAVITNRINKCTSIGDLLTLYKQDPVESKASANLFSQRKYQLLKSSGNNYSIIKQKQNAKQP